MLPFLKPKKMASVIMAKYKKDASTETIGDEGEAPHKLMPIAERLISAIHAKDSGAVASVLQDLQENDDAADEEQE